MRPEAVGRSSEFDAHRVLRCAGQSAAHDRSATAKRRERPVLRGSGVRVARLRVISGDTPIGPDDNVHGAGKKHDVVAMDDFIYGEPRAIN